MVIFLWCFPKQLILWLRQHVGISAGCFRQLQTSEKMDVSGLWRRLQPFLKLLMVY